MYMYMYLDRNLAQPNNMEHYPECTYLRDRVTNTVFLVDTGACMSLFPASQEEMRNGPTSSAMAGTGLSFPTYGYKMVTLEFGLGRPYAFRFTLAKDLALLGMDFLSYYEMIVDSRNHSVEDKSVTRFRLGIGPPPLLPHEPPLEVYLLDRTLWVPVMSGSRSELAVIDTGASYCFIEATPQERALAEQAGEVVQNIATPSGYIKQYGHRYLHVFFPNCQGGFIKCLFGTVYPSPTTLIGSNLLAQLGMRVDCRAQMLL